ncbi:MAG TPA: hypothetical protein VGA97_02980 [Acidimicrobiia bacterium]
MKVRLKRPSCPDMPEHLTPYQGLAERHLERKPKMGIDRLPPIGVIHDDHTIPNPRQADRASGSGEDGTARLALTHVQAGVGRRVAGVHRSERGGDDESHAIPAARYVVSVGLNLRVGDRIAEAHQSL